MAQDRWDEIHKAYGSYISSLKDRLQITDDCILLDNRVVIPQQMRKFLLDAIHDTHPGFQTMKMLTQDVWSPNIHHNIGCISKNCTACSNVGKNLKPLIPNKEVGLTKTPTEPNEIIQMDFAGPLPDGNDKNVYILVSIDKYSKLPNAMDCANTSAKSIMKFLEKHIILESSTRTTLRPRVRFYVEKN